MNKRLLTAVAILSFFASNTVFGACQYGKALELNISGKQRILNWTTLTESNNSLFVIEKSNDGIHFNKVAELEAAGNSEKELKYRFTDFGAVEGIVFYRLLQLDYDGTMSFSHIVIGMEENPEDPFKISAISNTVTNKYTSMIIRAKKNIKVPYRCIGLDGQILKEGDLMLSKGINAFTMDLEKVPVGSFTMSMMVEESAYSFMMKKVDGPLNQEENIVTRPRE